MSDNPTNTPPKPKPGSLRDRIAAFENKATANSPPAGPPPPRPKPAGFATWKPKQPSPPSSPAAASSSASASSTGAAGNGSNEGVARAGSGTMNAADARESITRGGASLKERMAALQGKGAFGAPAPPPVVPKPAAGNKPKWKPPPPITSPPAIGEDDESNDQAKDSVEGEERLEGRASTSPKPSSIKSPPPILRSPKSGLEDQGAGDEGEGSEVKEDAAGEQDVRGEKEGQVDEEEEERQRRAAIAARLAKLGGARIGMGPPVFGRPVPPKKPSVPETAPVVEAEPPKVEEGMLP